MKAGFGISALVTTTLIFATSSFAQQPPSRQEIAQRSSLVQRTIDQDKDGALSAAEIAGAPAALASLDKDGSGDLSPLETHGGRFPIWDIVRSNWAFNFIDHDGDITISKKEIANAPKNLLGLDLDKDGKLAPSEFVAPQRFPPPWMGVPPDIQGIIKFTRAMRARNYEEAKGPVLPGADDRVHDAYMFFYGADDNDRRQVQSNAYLMDVNGKIVHTWTNTLETPEGVSAYLQEDGTLIRTSAKHNWRELRHNFPVGANGTLEIVDWDSNVLWSYDYCELRKHCLHHDFTVLPNGNVVAIVYQANTVEEATAFGWRGKTSKTGQVFTERLIEIEPDLKNGTGKIVWEWDVRDHLVQNVDKSLPNYGDVTKLKTRIDPNYDRIDRLFIQGQLFHLNSIDYNAMLDQLIVSSATFGEVWIIDHGITTKQAKGPAGDLLYRWGSPRTHGAGPDEDTVLFWQHDAYWTGRSGEVQIFNNGGLRDKDGNHNPAEMFMGLLDGAYSDVLRLKLPVDTKGKWDWAAEPELVWSYNSDGSKGFYSPFMSGARVLPNGNVLMVQAHNNRVVEVNDKGETVLDFQMPVPGRIFRLYKYDKDYAGLKGRL